MFLKDGAFTRRKYYRIMMASVLSWIVTFIDSSADTILAGIYLGETSVSAVALVSPFLSLILFLSYLEAYGSTIMFSRENGAFNYERSYKIAGMGVIVSVAISVILILAMLVLRDPLMAFYDASPEITELAKDYFVVMIFYAAIEPLYCFICSLVEIDGDENLMFVATIVNAVVNIIASMLLVNSMGIAGLAYGTIIGTSLGLLTYVVHFFKKRNSIKFRFYFNIKDLLESFKIGSTSSATLLYIAIIDIVMNRFVIATFSDAYLPAYAVINLVLNFVAIFASAYEGGFGFISVAYGEKNPGSIRRTMKIAVRCVLVQSVILFAILELTASPLATLYGVTDPEVHTAATNATRIIAFGCPAMALYDLFYHYYSITGRVELGHVATMSYMLITPLLLAIPLGLKFGFNGLSFGFMLTSFVSVAITAIVACIRYGKKSLPLILDKTDEEGIYYDMKLSKENISGLCQDVQEKLTSYSVDPSVINEVQLILEESYMSIMEMNPGRKVVTECNLLVSDKSLRLITRDNGKIFDITDANADIKNLRSYVLARMMERNPERTNTTTISFNRNSYMWQLQGDCQ